MLQSKHIPEFNPAIRPMCFGLFVLYHRFTFKVYPSLKHNHTMKCIPSGARSLNILLLIIACSTLVAGCANEREPLKWPYGVWYEVFVRAYADSNGDGIGDLNGLTGKLDYLRDLGVRGLWLMPVMPSPSYHKYDVTDYRGIDPEYGTLADFRRLVAKAHKRGISVMVDLVVNHTATDNPWFVNARKGKTNPYRNYYVWAVRDSVRRQINRKKTTLDSDNLTQWHAVDGDTTAEHYYGFFWGGMPDLNHDNPAVRKELVSIGKFWLEEMGVDGFRLDAARHIFPDERAADNHAFWVWFRSEMEKIKPGVHLVGEVWSDAATVAPYLKGLPSLFNFDMAYGIAAAVNAGRDTAQLISRYSEILSFYQLNSSEFIDAVFLRNHDQNRILSELNGDMRKMRSAASILMTLPGTPYVYYGEEIGMLGRKPDEQIREPFLWDVPEKDASRSRWEVPQYSTDAAVVPLAVQQKDPASLVQFYRNWIGFRNGNPALTYGGLYDSGLGTEEMIAFTRGEGTEAVDVFHNISGNPVTVRLNTSRTSLLFAAGDGIKLKDGMLVLPAGTSAVTGR